ncbi:AEC family transporter [Rubneribacter sp.]|nr:AEC family transporter [Candidatus Rubneribacter avistercoris]
MVVLQQMIVFFVMMVLGVVLRRARIVTEDNQRELSSLVMNVACPALVISGAASATERIPPLDLAFCFGVFVAMLAFMALIGSLLPLLLHYPKAEHGAVNLMFVETNVSFIGLPLISNAYGPDAAFYMVLFLIPAGFFLYSYAIAVISKRADGAPAPQQGFARKAAAFARQLANPGMAACVIALALYLGGVELPYVLAEPVSMVGDLSAPLAMILIGASFADIKPRELFCDVRLNLFILLKMLIIPIVAMLALKQVIGNEYLLITCMVNLSAPTVSMAAMLALLYNKDRYLLITRAVALTTLVSVATMPIVSLVCGIG